MTSMTLNSDTSNYFWNLLDNLRKKNILNYNFIHSKTVRNESQIGKKYTETQLCVYIIQFMFQNFSL